MPRRRICERLTGKQQTIKRVAISRLIASVILPLLLVSTVAIQAAVPDDGRIPALNARQSSPLWQPIDEDSIRTAEKRLLVPARYRTVKLDTAALAGLLAVAPMENTAAAREEPPVITLPMPDGQLARFKFEELLILRYMSGLRDAALVGGVVDPMGSRTTAMAIESWIQPLVP